MRKLIHRSPSPWMAGVYHPTREMFERLKRPQSCVCVATVGPETAMVVAMCGDAEDPRSQADADLLAAAPDLLAACKEYLSATTGVYPRHWEMIKAAVAKAEGAAK